MGYLVVRTIRPFPKTPPKARESSSASWTFSTDPVPRWSAKHDLPPIVRA